MGFGGFLSDLVDSASSAAKSAAESIANGASYVGGKVADGAQYVADKTVQGAQYVADKTVQGAQYVADKTVQGAQYVADKTVQGAQYVADKAKQGAQWAADTATEGVRRATRGTVGVLAGAVGDGASAAHDVAQGVSNTYNKIKSVFTNKPPEQPCVNCTGKDVDHDGVLVGYKDGKCVPITNKGQPITPDDIKAAKRAGYNPVNNASDYPDDPKRTTSDATKACCSKCTAGKPPRTIFYVNGIDNTRTDHCNTLKQIGDSTCATVVGVYNATEGKVKDLYQTTQERSLIDQAEGGRTDLAHDGRNPAVDTLSDLVVMETRAGRPPELFAHSQGGAITSLALHDANNTLRAGPPDTPHDLSGMTVTSFGAAAPSWVQGPNYTHYVNVNDFTPMHVGLGDNPSDKAKGGPNSKFVAFSGGPDDAGPFATGKNIDKHVLPGMDKYHGMNDQMYLKMYEQEQKRIADEKRKADPRAKTDAGCQCGRR